MPDSSQLDSARQRTPARSLPKAVQRFIHTESAGGIALLAAAVVALVWANSPWRAAYDSLWHTEVVISLGPIELTDDLRHLVNDGLMALFFFLVGLEIKREAVRGELADLRVAALPVCAAVGGMVVPAGLYLAVTGGGPGSEGWGIPMATDIAFALGALTLLGTRVPASLKLLLLTLAIVDDIGAILVIASFYSSGIELGPLALAVGGLALAIALRKGRVDWPPLYAILGIAVWFATYKSGVHATIAGVALGLATPARPVAPAETAQRWAQDLSSEPSARDLRQMAVIARESVSPVEHLEERLHSVTSFLILPVFALANAGVELQGGLLGPPGAGAVAAGVALGLVVGKVVGILLGSYAAVRLRVATLPAGTRWSHIAGIGALGGIGFTVSLFVAELAFDGGPLTEAAKLSVLGASAAAALLGTGILLSASRKRATPPAASASTGAEVAASG